MRNKKLLKFALSTLTALTLAVSTPALAYAELVEDTIDVDASSIYESWINYPDSSFGEAYNAGWSYNASENYLNTTENVGWTGFYNPDITNFTTGKFTFSMKNTNFDPCGFTWGMQVSGTDEDPVYSFYAYEECEHSGRWSIAYISEWHPALDGGKHKGPLYHATIDADDYSYVHDLTEGTNAARVGFSDGTVLAYGKLDSSLYNEWHNVEIEVDDKTVTVLINGETLTTVDADVVSGGFGPYAVSNPSAYFSKLFITSTNEVAIHPEFEYQNASGEKINEAYVGDAVTIKDASTSEGAAITNYYWTVTKDDEEIYTGDTPYTEYTKETGTYVTSLYIKNAYGITSSVYSDTLVVSEAPATLTPVFIYVSDGKEVSEVVKGTKVSIEDKSTFTVSPIASTHWEVKKDGESVYSGETPYDAYTNAAGTYETTLTLTNGEGTTAVYTLNLIVTEPPVETTAAIETTQRVTTAQTSPATGDNNSVNVLAVELVVALAAGVSVIAFKSKEKED